MVWRLLKALCRGSEKKRDPDLSADSGKGRARSVGEDEIKVVELAFGTQGGLSLNEQVHIQLIVHSPFDAKPQLKCWYKMW